MLTGSSDTVDVKKCLSAGANDYLAKPIDVNGFKKRLSRCEAGISKMECPEIKKYF